MLLLLSWQVSFHPLQFSLDKDGDTGSSSASLPRQHRTKQWAGHVTELGRSLCVQPHWDVVQFSFFSEKLEEMNDIRVPDSFPEKETLRSYLSKIQIVKAYVSTSQVLFLNTKLRQCGEPPPFFLNKFFKKIILFLRAFWERKRSMNTECTSWEDYSTCTLEQEQ